MIHNLSAALFAVLLLASPGIASAQSTRNVFSRLSVSTG
jgi:hypothetical protein